MNDDYFQFRDYGGDDVLTLREDVGRVVVDYRYHDVQGKKGLTADLNKGVIEFAGTGETDTIKGGRIDELRATGAKDDITGTKKDEIFSPGAGSDKVDGGRGSDTVVYATHSSLDPVKLKVDLGKGEATGVIGGKKFTDTLISIENAAGSRNDDELVGDNSGNTLIGFEGDDKLVGKNGRDTLVANGGNDTLIGGKGRDTFVFSDDNGYYRIRDFNTTGDRIDLSAVTEIKNFKDLWRSHIAPDANGKDVEIRDHHGTTIRLHDTDIDHFSGFDFIF